MMGFMRYVRWKVNGKVTTNPLVSLANGINKRLGKEAAGVFGMVAKDVWKDGKYEFLQDLEARINGQYPLEEVRDMLNSFEFRIDKRVFGPVVTISTENKFLYAREEGQNIRTGGNTFEGVMRIPYMRAIKNPGLRDYIKRNRSKMKSYNTSSTGEDGQEDIVLRKVKITKAPFMAKVLERYHGRLASLIADHSVVDIEKIIQEGARHA